MNALFLTFVSSSLGIGVVKKIQAQVKAIQNCGFEHTYLGMVNDLGQFLIDDINFGRPCGLKEIRESREFFNRIRDFILSHDIKFVYYRSNCIATPYLVAFFKALKRNGVKCVMEIPTYPYDGEFKSNRKGHLIDLVFRRLLARQMDYIVTFADLPHIFGQRTITISNGVDIDAIPLWEPIHNDGLNMIAVANLSYWHGYDRVIEAMAKKEIPNIKFHIISGKPSKYVEDLRNLVNKYELQNQVLIYGEMSGKELDNLFNECDIAIGSLGRHRNGIVSLKTLKNVEYAVRGIPFVYSEQNPDFDHMPYVLKVPMDDSPIDLEAVVDFAKKCALSPAEIRATATQYTWQNQMQKIISNVFPQ